MATIIFFFHIGKNGFSDTYKYYNKDNILILKVQGNFSLVIGIQAGYNEVAMENVS
jgi:hypothetical protein